MAKMTISQLEAQTNEKFASIEAQLQTLIDLAQNNTMANVGKTEKPERNDAWLSEFPKYGTPAQRVEYDKLANYARSRYAEMQKVHGESVRCFIAVPKKQDLMPHYVTWKECPKLK